MTGSPSDESIIRAAGLIRAADALVITAGAGMGVDGGLPDFRGRDGLWRAYPPLARLGIDFPAMANPRWFRTAPRLAWGFYGHRLALYRETPPHAGYRILHDWCVAREHVVLTSNVDGHFLAAGFAPERVVELHGSIHLLQCSVPCSAELWPATGHRPAVDAELHETGELPACPRCGALARPNILMFDDPAWIADRSHEQETRVEAWLHDLGARRPVVIELGAGIDIPTVRMTGAWIARHHHAPLVRINPKHPEGGESVLAIPAGALAALEAIDRQLLSMW